MKIRNGFVSNSSSSSFVFGLPKGMNSVEDIKNLMFEDGIETYDWFKDEPNVVPGQEAAEALKRDSDPFDPKVNVVGDDYWEKKDRIRHYVYDTDYEAEGVKDLVESHPDLDFYIVEYSDDSEFDSAMEHGDHWDKVPSVRISHH